MDDGREKEPTLAEIIGAKLGQIIIISLYQARATLTLAQAIEKDPSVSSEVRSAAKDSLAAIDQVIDKLEEAIGDSEIKTIRGFVGRTEND